MMSLPLNGTRKLRRRTTAWAQCNQCNLGVFYELGTGCEIDLVQAIM